MGVVVVEIVRLLRLHIFSVFYGGHEWLRFGARSSANVLIFYSRLALMRSLLSPYENRPWAQTNWILVQMWKVMQCALHCNYIYTILYARGLCSKVCKLNLQKSGIIPI